jgi:hypothetical protein
VQQADFARFHAVMTGMAKVYERELDGPLLDAYWLCLRDWSLADFEAAAAHLMRSARFMPRPADFNDLRKAAGKTLAAEAWFTAGTSADPVANRAMHIATQGRYVGHIPLDELPWVQKRFLQVYDEMQDVGEARAALPHLNGHAALPSLDSAPKTISKL